MPFGHTGAAWASFSRAEQAELVRAVVNMRTLNHSETRIAREMGLLSPLPAPPPEEGVETVPDSDEPLPWMRRRRREWPGAAYANGWTTPPEPSTTANGRRRRHWQRVGVELEGGYNEDPRNYLTRAGIVRGSGTFRDGNNCVIDRVQFGTDGSVHTNAAVDGRETRIGPYLRWRDVASTMMAMYPDRTNETCGLHFHTSFRVVDYSRFMSREFHTYFLERWESWANGIGIPASHAFWNRWRGCRYTERNGANGDVDYSTGANRYQQLNYSAWNDHGTLECRMLPAFHDRRLAILAIAHGLQVYEDWLALPSAAPVDDVSISVGNSAEVPAEIAVRKLDLNPADAVETATIGSELEWPDLSIMRQPAEPGVLRRLVVLRPNAPVESLLTEGNYEVLNW